MAHYYSRIKGHRGEATRCGAKASGITARADSYTVGARIEIEWSTQLQSDIVTIYATTGSNSNGSRIFSYTVQDGKRVILDTAYPEFLL